MLKSLLGNPLLQFLVGRTIGLYMLLVGWTTHWTRVNQAAVEPFWTGDGRLIACIWHGRFMQIHKLWRFRRGDTKAKMLISRSREGGIVAHASRTVGAEVIRGSSAKENKDKGGYEAGRELVRQIEGGGTIAMTPDGPRGPRMRARLGPVQLARMAQAPLLPLAWASSRQRVFSSWDKFLLPFPFGRGALIWGEPIAPPPPDADAAAMEACRLALETELNRISAEADRLVGAPVIEPAPARAKDAERQTEATVS